MSHPSATPPFAKKLGYVFSGILFIATLYQYQIDGFTPKVLPEETKNTIGTYYEVTKVTDGDTVHIMMNGRDEKVRLIGINTPETVDPRRPVQCFGKEASARMK